MKRLSISKSPLRSLPASALALGCLAALIAPDALRACGPDFPNRYLDAPNALIFGAPEAMFAHEIERIAPSAGRVEPESAHAPIPTDSRVANLLVGELQAVLTQGGLDPEKARQLALAASAAAERGDTTNANSPSPTEIPKEFLLYFESARAFREGRMDDARAHCAAILDLPENERRHRSTWAAYLPGFIAAQETTTLATQPASYDDRLDARATAVKWLRLTRELAAQGFTDVADLGAESVGWEAFAELHTGNYVAAISLYLRHHEIGHPTAVDSLRFVMRRLCRDDAWKKDGLGEKLAHDEPARRVFTAWLLARGGPAFAWNGETSAHGICGTALAWAEKLKSSGVRDVPAADRLAWVAYQGGNFDLAREWVDLAPPASGAAEWIRGKLALRRGDLANGEHHLRAAAADPDLAPQRPVILGELGRVRLARDCPKGALAAWLEGGHWEDAAYVAERVLSLKELIAVVDRMATDSPAAPAKENPERTKDRGRAWAKDGDLRGALRHLLARRLMRANRPAEAEAYFPESLQRVSETYAANVSAGFDPNLADEWRAAAFWRAAKTAKADGLELLGTELAPDWAIWGGRHEADSPAEARAELAQKEGGPLVPTAIEKARLEEHAVPEKRFHYRYRAAQLAWWAASLMPNDSEETAEILNEAGGWLKRRDPQAANPFYQALAIRCGRTTLGQKATERRWLPD